MRPLVKRSLSLLKLVLVIALLYGVYFYFNNYQKEALNKLYLSVDRWGITDVGRAELDRENKINDLDIPFAQRQALINHTVFFGANAKMVLLALGNPIDKPVVNTQQQIWVYYFDDYDRPTSLSFIAKGNDWILNSAEKTK